jgi:L-fuconolactonase
MVTEANPAGWKYEDFLPYLDAVTSAFGTERLMLGSDWPVCRLAGEYGEVMKIPLKYYEDLAPGEKEKLQHRNAVDCYHLKHTAHD